MAGGLTFPEIAKTRPLAFPLASTAPDLLAYPFWDVPVPIITVNQAWKIVEPTYHVCAEQWHYHQNPDVYERLSKDGKLVTVGGGWGSLPAPGYNVAIKGVPANLSPIDFEDAIWSTDLRRDGVVICFGLTGTVSYSALQVAVYLGFTEIFFAGLDLHGPKFTGQPTGKLDAQREQFRAIAPRLEREGLKVKVIGLDSRCDAFPRIEWPWPACIPQKVLDKSGSFSDSSGNGYSPDARSGSPA